VFPICISLCKTAVPAIHVDEVPEGVVLAAGMTGTVQIDHRR